MGESDRVDLNELASGLDALELAEVVDFVGYLKSKHERQSELGRAYEIWEEVGASEMASSLADLERDLPPEDVQLWLSDLKENAIPVQFNPESGEIEEKQA